MPLMTFEWSKQIPKFSEKEGSIALSMSVKPHVVVSKESTHVVVQHLKGTPEPSEALKALMGRRVVPIAGT